MAFHILEYGIRKSKAVSPHVVPFRRVASRGNDDERPAGPGNAERPGLERAFKKAWRPTTSSGGMDEVVSKIVPNTQPIIPSAPATYGNPRSTTVGRFSAHVIGRRIVPRQVIANQVVGRRHDPVAEHGVTPMRHRGQLSLLRSAPNALEGHP